MRKWIIVTLRCLVIEHKTSSFQHSGLILYQSRKTLGEHTLFVRQLVVRIARQLVKLRPWCEVVWERYADRHPSFDLCPHWKRLLKSFLSTNRAISSLVVKTRQFFKAFWQAFYGFNQLPCVELVVHQWVSFFFHWHWRFKIQGSCFLLLKVFL